MGNQRVFKTPLVLMVFTHTVRYSYDCTRSVEYVYKTYFALIEVDYFTFPLLL